MPVWQQCGVESVGDSVVSCLSDVGVFLANDPMDIIGRTASAEERADAAKKLGAAGLYDTARKAVLILAIISIACSLIGMLFVGKAEVVAEKKKDIMQKLLIVLMGGSTVSILNIVMYFIESIVG